MASSSHAKAPGLEALPDDLLLTFLGPNYLTTMERYQSHSHAATEVSAATAAAAARPLRRPLASLPPPSTCRFSSPVLVCKRWHQLCHTPQLLRSLRIEIRSSEHTNPDAYLLRVQSLQRWLASHSQHVRSLHLSAANAHPYLKWLPATASFGDDITPGAIAERAALAACLQLCTQLEQLTLGDGTHPMGVETDEAADWLLSMPCLRRLNHLGDVEQLLRLPPGLSGLQQLEHANLEGAGMVLHLPRSLTSLQLYEFDPVALPEQVGAHVTCGLSLESFPRQALVHATGLRKQPIPHSCPDLLQLATLPQLQRLCLYYYEGIDTRSGSASCTRLASLSRLTHLCLVGTSIPAADCLARLPHLRQLAIETRPANFAVDREQLESALASGQQMTLLSLTLQHDAVLADIDDEDFHPVFSIPSSIAQLRNLQAFMFSIQCSGGADIDPRLPAGPWLQSLRWLAMPWYLALAQAGALAASAPALRRLLLSSPRPWMPLAPDEHQLEASYAPCLAEFEGFVSSHPALLLVGYTTKTPNWAGLPPFLVQRLLQLAVRRPALTVAAAPLPTFYPTDWPAFLDEPHLFGHCY